MNAQVRELPLTVADPGQGIDARYGLRWPNPDSPMGYDITAVIHVAGANGRWCGPATYLCSRHRLEPDDPRQPDDGSRGFCDDVQAVIAFRTARVPA